MKTLQEYADEHGLRGKMLLEEYDAGNKQAVNKIAYASNKRVMWRCGRCGHRWEAIVVNRTCHEGMCPECRAPHTSGDEQIIFSLLSRKLTKKGYQVLNRYKIGGHEIDVFVPGLGFGVELNGQFWHQSNYKRDMDQRKAAYFSQKGLDVLIVVEGGTRESAKGLPCDLWFPASDRTLLEVRRFIQWHLKDRYKISIDYEMTEDEIFLSRLAARKPIEDLGKRE